MVFDNKFGMFGDLVDESKYVTKLSEIENVSIDNDTPIIKSEIIIDT